MVKGLSDRIVIVKLNKTDMSSNVLSFISKEEWPPSLPNLNPSGQF